MATLHVCLDESGDLRFTPKGSKYYIFAVAWTFDPRPLAHDLGDLRYSLLKQGHDLHSFHATEDRQPNRDAVVAKLLAHNGWQFAGLVVEKAKVNPTIREDRQFYPQFASMLLKFVFRGRLAGANRVLAFTDTLPISSHKAAVIKTFKTVCRSELSATTPFEIYHHPRAANCWIQVADYCCWSLYRKWENGDRRTYDQLLPKLAATELDALRAGTTLYYAR